MTNLDLAMIICRPCPVARDSSLIYRLSLDVWRQPSYRCAESAIKMADEQASVSTIAKVCCDTRLIVTHNYAVVANEVSVRVLDF